MSKTSVFTDMVGAVVLVALSVPPVFGQSGKPGRGACEINCGSSKSTPSVDPTSGALMQIQSIYEQNASRRKLLQLEREERRAAREAQWQREEEAARAAWPEKRKAYMEALSGKRREYATAVDRMRDRMSERKQNPMFLSKDQNQGILLGVGGIGDYSGGFSTLTDQNGNQVGSYRLSSRLSQDGKFVDVEIDVSNQSNCKMYFNGFFRKNETAYKVIDFGTGPEVATGGSTKLRARVSAGSKTDAAAIYRFSPTADFVQCGGVE